MPSDASVRTVRDITAPEGPPHPGMVRIEGGTFAMGSNLFYPEEAPVRKTKVGSFWIDRGPVTNAEFAEFVAATGHVTTAEIPPDPADYPGIKLDKVFSGSAVFEKCLTLDLTDPLQWWHFVAGASWRHPQGPGSSIEQLADHPAVHVSWSDAATYAAWAGKTLPTEAEWEYAARGGLELAEFAWGDELAPDGQALANYWQGLFPVANLKPAGWERTSPVGAFPPNGYGLADMIGNVWEWTADDWSVPQKSRIKKKCCAMPKRQRPGLARKVLKGGSHLCAPNYCQRYRPAARHPETIETSTSHIGFRCLIRG